MAIQVISLNCPNCNAPVNTGQEKCASCRQPILITSFSNLFDMPMSSINKYTGRYREVLSQNPENKELNNAIAMCYLKLRLYDKAIVSFEKAMEDNFNNSETFFYASVCLLQGKKAFLAQRVVIDKIEEYIQAALRIEPKGIYYYFWAYIKYDYFTRKYFRTIPTYEDTVVKAQSAGVSPNDIEQLFTILNISKPDTL